MFVGRESIDVFNFLIESIMRSVMMIAKDHSKSYRYDPVNTGNPDLVHRNLVFIHSIGFPLHYFTALLLFHRKIILFSPTVRIT